MADDNRKAQLTLDVKTKGAKEAGRDVDRIGDFTDTLRSDFKNLNIEAEKVADTIRKDIGGALKEAERDALDFKKSSADSIGGGGGGGNAPAAAKFRGAASLVGGGEIVGLIDDFQDLGEGITALTGDVTKSAGAALSAGLAFGAATIAIAVIGAALAAFTAEQQKSAKVIEDIVDAQRTVDEKINAGATTQQLNEERELLLRNLEDEKQRLIDLNAQYDAQFKDEGIVDGFSRLFVGAEDGLSSAISTTEAGIASLQIEIDALTGGLSDTEIAANDAATAAATVQQAEVELASTRTTTAVDGVREAEKAAREQERIEEKAQQQVEKASQEAAQQAEKAAAAQENYAKGIKNVNTQFKQAVEDIGTKRGEGETDIRINQGRDLADIELKNNKDVTKLISDDWRSARDDALKNAAEIDDIRREGHKSELEAERDGDFKQLFLSREALKERLGEEKRTDDREDQMRQIHMADAKDDLKTSFRDELSTRRNASLRQMEDLKLSTSRELAQAMTAKQRGLEINASGFAAELRQLADFNNKRLQMNTQTNQQLLNQGGNRVRAGNTQSAGGISGQSTIDMSGVNRMMGRIIGS